MKKVSLRRVSFVIYFLDAAFKHVVYCNMLVTGDTKARSKVKFTIKGLGILYVNLLA